MRFLYSPGEFPPFLENAAEIVDGLKARGLGDPGDGIPGKAQQLPGPDQTAVPDVLDGGLVEGLFEQAVQLARVHPAGFAEDVRG